MGPEAKTLVTAEIRLIVVHISTAATIPPVGQVDIVYHPVTAHGSSGVVDLATAAQRVPAMLPISDDAGAAHSALAGIFLPVATQVLAGIDDGSAATLGVVLERLRHDLSLAAHVRLVIVDCGSAARRSMVVQAVAYRAVAAYGRPIVVRG